MNWSILIVSSARDLCRQEMWDILGRPVPCPDTLQPLETLGVRKDGRHIPLELTLSGMMTADGFLAVAVIRDRSWRKETEDRERRNIEDLQFLSATAMRFAELWEEDDLYRYIGEQIRVRVPASIVVITSYDERSDTFTVRRVCGNETVVGKILNIIGDWTPRMEFPGLKNLDRTGMTPGEFLKMDKDIYEFSSHRIPDPICRLIKRVFPIDCIYSMNISRRGQLFGNVNIVISGEAAPERMEILKIFINQAAVALQRKLAEEILVEEKERLSITLGSIGDGVIATDTGGQVVLMNDIAGMLTGWAAGEATGRALGDVLRLVDPSSREPFDENVWSWCTESSQPQVPVECLVISRSGSGCPVSFSSAPIRDRAGAFLGVVLIIRDITPVKKMEEEQSRAEKLESLGVLAGGIAHDFNNILTSILGNISLAQMDLDPGTFSFLRLNEAEKAIKRAQGITGQLLTFSKGGAPVRKVAAIPDIIREVTGFALSGSNVMCRYSFAGDLRPVSVDASQFSQVIQNLVINAMQAMPDGGFIDIVAENVVVLEGEIGMLAGGDYVRITVRDQGPGIPAEILPRIFDPYVTSKKGGTGLGLALTHSIIIRHEGHIQVVSEEGAGAVFVIHLPASSGSVHWESGTPPHTAARGSCRILLMDDEEEILGSTTMLLEHLGYRVTTASGGQEAIERFKKALTCDESFGAVVLDLTIPGGMGGAEVVMKLRAMDPGVRAIVSSGYSDTPVMAQYEKYGFCAVLRKPYGLDELRNVLGAVFEGEYSSSRTQKRYSCAHPAYAPK
jgi:PAS domain S-box-containing protein